MKLFDLHNSAYTRVGRVSLCLIATFAFSFTSCEKDIITTEDALHADMLDLYTESQGLMETSADSVVNYATKFEDFHNLHPECEDDEYYPPIVNNIDSAYSHYNIAQNGNINLNAGWDGVIDIDF